MKNLTYDEVITLKVIVDHYLRTLEYTESYYDEKIEVAEEIIDTLEIMEDEYNVQQK